MGVKRMNKKRWIAIWKAERDEVIKTYDVEQFREFYKKWQARGLYEMPLPANDSLIEITMRKMVCHLENATKEEKAEAERWLTEHGCSTEM